MYRLHNFDATRIADDAIDIPIRLVKAKLVFPHFVFAKEEIFLLSGLD